MPCMHLRPCEQPGLTFVHGLLPADHAPLSLPQISDLQLTVESWAESAETCGLCAGSAES